MELVRSTPNSPITDNTVTSVFGGGLFFLDVLIGTLLAMSAQSLATSVIAAMFTLFGGSLVAFLP